MSRRGEGQFVAIEVNLLGDPKLRGMARRLKIPRVQAIGHLALLRELVLTRGTGGGVLKGYTADEIAEFVEWPKSTTTIVEAFKGAGVLVARRGTFLYPGWAETITGDYANRRASLRRYDRDRKREERGGDDPDVRGNSVGHPHGRPSDVRTDSSPESRDQSIKESARNPPETPPPGGAVVASRLEWFGENYPKGIVNPERCAALLGVLSEAEWAHLQYAVTRRGRSNSVGERARGPLAEVFLAKSLWRAVKLPRTPAKAPRTEAPKEGPKVEDLEAARQAFEERANIRAELVAKGVPRRDLEDRIDEELTRRSRRETDQAAAGLPS